MLPNPHPTLLDWEDFENVRVTLMSDYGNIFEYSTRIFVSIDYCIAVITHNDFRFWSEKSSEEAFEYFSKTYFTGVKI